MVDFAVNPRKLALINVDLQNAFVEGTPVSAPDGPAVVARVNKLAAACRSVGMRSRAIDTVIISESSADLTTGCGLLLMTPGAGKRGIDHDRSNRCAL
jgi:isochorismate hydrolase